ncbi:MAG: 2-phosphosulfolactate phosphatase [Anaerolineae bacterium]|nr:2-phosphosulfolactate phosphatase [Anaerolineae bacterium]
MSIKSSSPPSPRPPQPDVVHLRGAEGALAAGGLTIVIDVLRAFTTAAYAFAAGAADIVLVSTVEEAFAVRERFPDALLIGEVGGRLIPGFDLNNSPTRMRQANVAGRRLIQRTGAGTQGVVLAAGAAERVLASLVVARATVAYVQSRAPRQVSLLATNPAHSPYNEDDACADYLAALLTGQPTDVAATLARVRASADARELTDSLGDDFPPTDLELALAIDCFDFAMPVERSDGLWTARCVKM